MEMIQEYCFLSIVWLYKGLFWYILEKQSLCSSYYGNHHYMKYHVIYLKESSDVLCI